MSMAASGIASMTVVHTAPVKFDDGVRRQVQAQPLRAAGGVALQDSQEIRADAVERRAGVVGGQLVVASFTLSHVRRLPGSLRAAARASVSRHNRPPASRPAVRSMSASHAATRHRPVSLNKCNDV
jgi:hypothetical protein